MGAKYREPERGRMYILTEEDTEGASTENAREVPLDIRDVFRAAVKRPSRGRLLLCFAFDGDDSDCYPEAREET